MNKITSKSNVLFDMNEIIDFKPVYGPAHIKELTILINYHKREYKKYYNSVIKHKLGKRC